MDAEPTTTVGAVVVEELKSQARKEGYLVLAVREDDFWLLAACAVYFLFGYSVARR